MKLLLLWRSNDSVLEAEMIAAQLRAEGIHSVIQSDPLPGAAGILQGAEVYVDEKDFDRAKELITNAAIE